MTLLGVSNLAVIKGYVSLSEAKCLPRISADPLKFSGDTSLPLVVQNNMIILTLYILTLFMDSTL